jgi:acid phosphatase family membrane protein YuiD
MHSGIIFGNKLLDVVFISMFAAQLNKLISSYFPTKKIEWSRLWETGGMPSSHSASVIALTTAVAITDGFRSIAFAICVVFSIVVMFDAAGIRKAAGDHAGVINQLTDFFSTAFDKKFHNEKLKELLGHSRTEVFVGAVLGLLIALLMKRYLLS